jgi:phosphoribosylformimino-5-aminoimidazole carboxamide ribotide isomerase
MQIIPAIDLLGDAAVRLEQGDYERVLFRWPVEEFMDLVVATSPPLIHVVDLEGARDGRLRSGIVLRCVKRAADIPLQVSGGIRSLDHARQALELGASRVLVGTAAWSDPESLAAFADALGPRLIVALDVRDGVLAVRGWRESTGLTVDEAITRCREAGVARLHVTAIERDGTMRGPDLDLYRRVVDGGIPVVAAGGVRDDDDVAALDEAGCEAAIMGVGYLPRLGIFLNAPE